MNTGVSWPILYNVDPPLPHFESQWLRVLRDFLKSINARLRLDHTYIPKLQRVNDSPIMDHVLLCKSFKPIDIQRFQLLPVVPTGSDSQRHCNGIWLPAL